MNAQGNIFVDFFDMASIYLIPLNSFLNIFHVLPISSETTFVSAMAGMKFVSPFQRGTRWKCMCLSIPAPAILPIFAPKLNPCGFEMFSSAFIHFPVTSIISLCSSPEIFSKRDVWRYGTIIKWPLLYGNLFITTKQNFPRQIIRFSASVVSLRIVQKRHEWECFFSPKVLIYAERQGEKRCFILKPVNSYECVAIKYNDNLPYRPSHAIYGTKAFQSSCKMNLRLNIAVG